MKISERGRKQVRGKQVRGKEDERFDRKRRHSPKEHANPDLDWVVSKVSNAHDRADPLFGSALCVDASLG